MTYETLRYPLSPVQEPNQPAEAAAQEASLPDMMKGENLDATEAAHEREEPPRLQMSPTGDESVTEPARLARLSVVVTPDGQGVREASPPAAGDETTTSAATTPLEASEASWEGGAPPIADNDAGHGVDGLGRSPAHALSQRVGESTSGEESEQEDAVQALLALQRVPSAEPTHCPQVLLTGTKRRADTPPLADNSRHSPMPRGDAEPRFFCKFPRCGKGYASTDAVRKHCRQRHLEWLRRLGHGCPALYCRWGGEAVPDE